MRSIINLKGYFLLSWLVVTHFLPVEAQFSKQKNKVEKQSVELEQEAMMFFLEGMKEYVLDNYGKAILFFEKTIQLQPTNHAAYYMVANVQLKQGSLFKAIKYAEEAIKLEDKNKYYYSLLGQIYERKQDFNEAAKVYHTLIKKIPNSEEVYYELGAVYLYQNKYEDAIKCYDKLEKIYGISEDFTKVKQQYYLKLGKLNEAINEGKKLIEAFPEETRYLLMQAEMLIANEKKEDAEKILQQLLKKEPNNPYGHLYLSEIYNQRKEPQKAQKELEEAFRSTEFEAGSKIDVLVNKINQLISKEKSPNVQNETLKNECLTLGKILVEVHPKDAKAYAINADALVLTGNNKAALENYLISARLDESNFKIWKQIVIIDQELGKLDSLQKHSERALELFPTQAIFWLYNGLAYQGIQNYKKATVAYEEGKKLSNSDKTLQLQFTVFLGDTYNGLKEYQKSDESFEEVLKEDANNHLVLNNYSYYLSVRKEKLDYAKKMSEKVIKEYPENPTYLDTYGWILYVMKDYNSAKNIFEKIVPQTKNGTIVEHYGDVLFQLGDSEKALEQWKKAKVLGETSEMIDKKIADKKLYE
jgi:tetratricopeptide (TPR) repeat protein